MKLTMRYLKDPLGTCSILFSDKLNSNKFCCPLKFSSFIVEILFLDKSEENKKVFSFPRKTDGTLASHFELPQLCRMISCSPKILNDGTPQNVCKPIAGTLDSTIRRISSFLNAWNAAPSGNVVLSFLIMIVLMSSSKSSTGICFIFPVEYFPWQ